MMKKIVLTSILMVTILPSDIYGFSEPENNWQNFYHYLSMLHLGFNEDPAIPQPSLQALQQQRELMERARNACNSFGKGTWWHDYFHSLKIGYKAIINILVRELNRQQS